MNSPPSHNGDQQSAQKWDTELFVLRAESREQLRSEIDTLDRFLENQPQVSPLDLAYRSFDPSFR